MFKKIWLDAIFTKHWQGQDVFLQARKIQGEIFRKLEQRETLAFEVEGARYFIKKHRGAKLGEILKNLLSFRLPVVSAHNEFVAISAMQTAGISVPIIAAYGKRGIVPSQLESFLVTQDVGPHETLEDYCRPWQTQPPTFVEKWQLLQQVADISRRMHAAGICHRDFYICHLLKTQGRDELTVIDLHRALHKSTLGKRWIIKDLAGLYFSALEIGLTQRDLLRFIRIYKQQDLRQSLSVDKAFWRSVQRRALKLYARHQ